MYNYQKEELKDEIDRALNTAWQALNCKEHVPLVYHLMKALEELDKLE